MALVRPQLQLRADQLVLREANRVLAEHKRALVVVESRFKILKKKIMIKIVLALIQQNHFRQRLLFRRLEQLNRVSHCFKQKNYSQVTLTCLSNVFYLSH